MDEESDDKDDTKRKSRNLSEKKRRDQFNSLVNDLSALITPSNRKMDKSTVLKSTIAFLKHHNEATDRSKVYEIDSVWKPPFLTNNEFTHLMLEAIDGFIFVFGGTGVIYYVSDNVTPLLGYLPSDILKMTLFDLTHATSHETIYNIFLNPLPAIEPQQTGAMPTNSVVFHALMKRQTLGEGLNFNDYELVKFVGYLRKEANSESGPSSHNPPSHNCKDAASQRKFVFVGSGRVVVPQLIREMPTVDAILNEFTSKHSLEWKFLFLDNRAPPIIGYFPFEVLGTSGYDYYHFDDLDDIVKDHEELMQKGEGKSCFYRFLTKGQQWIWLQTSFYVSYHQQNSKPDYVVCTHKVLNKNDIIRHEKMSGKGRRTLDAFLKRKDAEISLRNTPGTLEQHLSGDCGSSALLGIESIKEWAGATASASTSASPPPRPLKSSHPTYSYGNIASENAPSIAKRKRHSRQNFGNESDSASVSGDSKTSRYSLLTHLSSHIRQRRSMSQTHQTPKLVSGPHDHQQIPNNLQQQQSQPSLHPSQNHQQPHPQHHFQTQSQQMNQSTLPSKRLPLLQHHSVPTGAMIADSSCQFTTRPFPFQNPPPPVVAPAFLESSQLLAAIPVQPVIAPFPLSPVQIPTLPPISLGLTAAVAANPNPILQSSCIRHEVDLETASGLVMTPNQSQLQDQLQLKHDELQKLIMQQQDELRMVSEQLLLSRYSMQQPIIPASYNNASGGSTRNLHCVSSGTQQHGYNQYDLPISDSHTQQFQQHHHQQHHQNLTATHQQQLHSLPQHNQQQQQQQQQPQQQQQQHVSLSQSMQQASGHHHHQQQQLNRNQQHQESHPSLLSQNVADLEQFGDEEIDAFLNLSPLQSLVSLQTSLSQNSDQPTTIDTNNKTHTTNSNNKNNVHQTVQSHNEDPLLSYMQMTSEPSLGISFQMGLSDDGSETPSEDAKLLYNHLDLQPHQQHGNTYFPVDPLQSVTQPASVSSNHIPNDLDILPYNVLREESENLLNPTHMPPDV